MSDSVQKIKDTLSILDVISPYVELHKAGKNFKGKSPFAAEKTPSFYVSPDRGMYYCFSTSQGGDMFTFVQTMEGVDFKGALKILADKAGVELVPEDPKKRSERERQLAALQAATAFYESSLQRKPAAVEYLQSRGVLPETIAAWRIGYAPGPPEHGWRETKEKLAADGFTEGELLQTGLIKTTDSGKEPFDVFRDRIMFPLKDSSGQVVAFSGRILTGGSEAPKYVNSPETALFKKSELLYGYDKAKTGIRNLGFSLIVEGQFDVVMCHQAGYVNTVAVSGTALTVQHTQLLERLSDKVVLALDADRAGINAMKKAAELMLDRGLDVKVATMPAGKDPADLIQENLANFKAVVGNSVHVIEFLLHTLRKEISDDRAFKLKTREEILPFVLLLPSRIDQDHFVEVIHTHTAIAKDAIRFDIDRLREERSTTSKTFGEPIGQSAPTAPIKNNLAGALAYVTAATEIIDQPYMQEIKKKLEALDTAEIEMLSESEYARVMFTLEQQFSKTSELGIQDELVTKLNQLKVGVIKQKIAKGRAKITVVEREADEQSLTKLLQEITEYEKELKEPLLQIADILVEKD